MEKSENTEPDWQVLAQHAARALRSVPQFPVLNADTVNVVEKLAKEFIGGLQSVQEVMESLSKLSDALPQPVRRDVTVCPPPVQATAHVFKPTVAVTAHAFAVATAHVTVHATVTPTPSSLPSIGQFPLAEPLTREQQRRRVRLITFLFCALVGSVLTHANPAQSEFLNKYAGWAPLVFAWGAANYMVKEFDKRNPPDGEDE